ncbi:aminoglycoside N(3)-acetyltransferase [Streptomyces pristinaespiralis]|uniref:Aminoglycoside 3-N-acetyltransferase n=1 Tax=Streptomyces pristinaespiralis TaxID=38300 RepID=A0A0M3QIN3_STRPR|nr:AAC(3) family N-acetyltransferase [Streptomyces pristinaespiralis]ALC21799.1 aminoglycoside 3-N-acetyltransferase [Streptomyces pristinaespiralis]QMU15516.1 AAC(3) family N-acetyltransferase [Streptomyces pristinaespiralis]
MRNLDEHLLAEEFRALGVRRGMVLVVHASLSRLGHVEGGAPAVVAALRSALGPAGTLAVPAFTPSVADPCPDAADAGAEAVVRAREQVPLFRPGMPTEMGAIPNAVLALPGRLRSAHPQVSVAAIGPDAERVTAVQTLSHAVGGASPFAALLALDARILLLGVGHNRNSFLHHAEGLVPGHRRKRRRFPYLVDGERVWVETEDVGDDNGRFFPAVGAAYEDLHEGRPGDGVRRRTIGAAECRLLPSVPFVEFARRRLTELLAA